MLKKLEENFIIILFIIIIALVFIQVISRYIIKESLSFSEEIVRYLFVWLTFFSISLAFRHDKHIKISLLSEKIKFFQTKYYHYLILCLGFLFFVLLFIYSIKITLLQYNTDQKIVLGVPTYFLGLSVVCGSILVLITYFKKFLEHHS